MTLLAQGWQNDIFESVAGGGGIPWIYVVLMVSWYYTLKHNMLGWYYSVEDYFGPAYGPVMAGPVFAWALHMFFYHTHSAIYALLDSHKGPWTKLKVSSFDKMTYSQMLPNVIKNQLIFLVSGVAAFYASSGRGWNRATEPYADISMKEALFEWVAMYLMYEAIFYTNHRILHITKLKIPFIEKPVNLYSLYHKEHHSTFASVGVSGLYMGSLDCVLTQTLPQVIGPAIFDFHPMVLWLGALIGSLNAVHTHSAYDFWGMSKPHGHELHHSRYKVNYGTGILDRLLSTRLEEHEVEREGFGLGGRLKKQVK